MRHKYTRRYVSYMGMIKKGSAKIDLLDFILLIFYWKMPNDLVVQLHLIFDETHIKAIINLDHHSATHNIAEKLSVSHACIEKKN